MPRRVVRVAPGTAEVDSETLRRGVATIQAELEVATEFPAEVLAEAEEAARSPRLPDLDRTDIPLLTIDPPGARDLDQALHLERTQTGFRVLYAIADVAAFVDPEGAVDELCQEPHQRQDCEPAHQMLQFATREGAGAASSEKASSPRTIPAARLVPDCGSTSRNDPVRREVA